MTSEMSNVCSQIQAELEKTKGDMQALMSKGSEDYCTKVRVLLVVRKSVLLPLSTDTNLA